MTPHSAQLLPTVGIYSVPYYSPSGLVSVLFISRPSPLGSIVHAWSALDLDDIFLWRWSCNVEVNGRKDKLLMYLLFVCSVCCCPFREGMLPVRLSCLDWWARNSPKKEGPCWSVWYFCLLHNDTGSFLSYYCVHWGMWESQSHRSVALLSETMTTSFGCSISALIQLMSNILISEKYSHLSQNNTACHTYEGPWKGHEKSNHTFPLLRTAFH